VDAAGQVSTLAGWPAQHEPRPDPGVERPGDRPVTEPATGERMLAA